MFNLIAQSKIMPSAQPNESNSLAQRRPDIAAQWHATKNGSLTPELVTVSSMKEVWWQCAKSKTHEWSASINSRTTRKSGCPFCAGKRINKSNSLATKNPALADEWHPNLNGQLTANDLSEFSGKPVWWQCLKDSSHTWQARVAKRALGHGCPYCAGNRVSSTNSIAAMYPDLVPQWHPTKNGDLKPTDLTWGSHQKVWWKCREGHEWIAAPLSRTHKRGGSGCPYCSGNAVDQTNSLAALRADLALQWHPTKNVGKGPADYTSGSSQRVWWVCPRGHEWQATISARNTGSGCPKCTKQTSRPELRILSELKPIFPDIVHRYRIGRLECDLLIPSINVVVQYDGAHFHGEKSEEDERNTARLEKLGFIVFRFRDQSLTKIRGAISFTEKGELKIGEIKRLLGKLSHFELSKKQERLVQRYLKQDTFWKDEEFLTLSAQIPGPMPGTSLADLFPEVAQRWDHARNGQLAPDKVTPSSSLRVYWICEKGHSYHGAIGDRRRGIGCPFCQRYGSKYTLPEDSLAATNPGLASEWHSKRNGGLTPTQISPHSKKLIWWICKTDPTHEWQATVSNRNGRKSGCPFCTGRKTDPKRSLTAVNPQLAAEWHPRRNGDLRPEQVTPVSQRKVWWQCSAIADHEWQATVSNRNGRKSGCPHCYAKSRARKS